MKHFAQRAAAVVLLLALINAASYGPGTQALLALGMGAALVTALAYHGHQAVTLAWDEHLRAYFAKLDKSMTDYDRFPRDLEYAAQRRPKSGGNWSLTLVGLLSALVVVVTGVLWGIR